MCIRDSLNAARSRQGEAGYPQKGRDLGGSSASGVPVSGECVLTGRASAHASREAPGRAKRPVQPLSLIHLVCPASMAAIPNSRSKFASPARWLSSGSSRLKASLAFPWSSTVSYTHLDVYKRQHQSNDALNCIAPLLMLSAHARIGSHPPHALSTV